ncbi:MAG: tetratricopeptide repeat protein [Candidatus Sulfotelmatobacter sp.]
MRHTKKILLTLLLACSPLFAQANPHQRLHDALLLEQKGQYDRAIDLVEQIIHSDELRGVELGRAWILLGFAYEVEGKFNESQAAFEHSLRILERDPEHIGDYASALDNYAGLYSDVGQLQIAAPMWVKALHLRQQTGDHAAVMRSLTKLAGLALAQKRVREADRYLKTASKEMKLTHDLGDDDSVVLFETQAWLALAQGYASDAVAGYQRALALCERVYGENHWLTGWEHLLRGKAYAQAGNMESAVADMREGVAILDHALGRKNPKYFAAEIAYSQVLDQAGSHVQAAQFRTTAEQSNKDFYGSQCVGCTINVAGFR